MRIEFEQSGGFAGLRRLATVDTKDLGRSPAKAFERVVADVLRADKDVSRSPKARDAALYDLRVERDGKVSVLSFDDASLTPRLAKLVALLEPLLRPVPP